MTEDSLDPAADANTIINRLRNVDRDILDDAHDITATDDGQAVEAAHVADNGEEVTLHFAHYTAYRSPEESPVEEIDIYATDSSDEHADQLRFSLRRGTRRPDHERPATTRITGRIGHRRHIDRDCGCSRTGPRLPATPRIRRLRVGRLLLRRPPCLWGLRKEFRMVYLKAFLLADADFSLIEEYTDEIEDQLEQHLNHDTAEQNEVEKSTDV